MNLPVRARAAGIAALMMTACLPLFSHAQAGAMAAKTIVYDSPVQVTPVADLPSQYVRPGTVQPGVVELDKKKGKFEFFDVDNLAGMAGGAIAAGIADQRRAEYYRQDFFYGGRPYYGSPYYGGPAYYGGSYSTYYYRK